MSTSEPCPHALTPREKQCLLWTLRGKSAWETGAILGISQHTVVKIVRSAALKLQSPNKQSAALKAMRLGLLDGADGEPPSPSAVEAPEGIDSIGPPGSARRATHADDDWPPVELAPGALAELRFVHCTTDAVAPILGAESATLGAASRMRRGTSTWQAPLRNALVRLRWRWAIAESGIVLLDDPLGIVTNARIVASEGAPMPERQLLLECMGVIHLLGWQDVVRDTADRSEQPR
jgi:DNA-binding CsgD family transcriptional regulator